MEVGIVGVGHGKFGNRNDASVEELAFESYKQALDDAKLTNSEINASVICSSPEYHKQRSLAGVIAEYLGLNPQPTYLVEAACASGSAGLRTAYSMIKSGMHDVVAVLGSQKMLELSTAEILALMGRVGDVKWESNFGTAFPSYYALYATAHMKKYGTTEEQLAMVAVKNHYYGAMNPNAMFQKEITLEKALGSKLIAAPLKLYDCCSNADGAACVILANETRAKKITDTPVWIVGQGCASASTSILRRDSFTSLSSTVEASRQAYKQARISPKDLDVAEVHDCFTIAELLAYEDLGFCDKGESGKLIEEKQTYLGGKIPVNLDGGLKAKGHPVGATGVSMAVEITKQLRGEAGNRQVKNAEIGLTHNVGGIGQYCFVTIYRR
ncbi:MAG: thiolase domain-containing protein [Candidatus Thermoplasmatota archaeon]|nr:thiolase domain-containing protein [Candidatus Thermoplasmatota archaeon]